MTMRRIERIQTTKQRIETLLKKHNLSISWQMYSGRWFLIIENVIHEQIWKRRGMNAKRYQDAILLFLESYDRRKQ